MASSSSGLPDIVQELLKAGANPNIRNKVYEVTKFNRMVYIYS